MPAPVESRGPCMTGFAERTRPRGACSKTAGDERRRTIQCTPTTPDTHPPRSISTRSPAFTPSQQSNGIFAYAARPPAASLHAHARCSSRSPLARPLPCVDRTIGERNLTTPRGLLAQLVELTTHCSDCATAHAFCSSRSPLARPFPCVDRTIGERNLTTPRGLLAQLVELTTHCSDCATAHAYILPPRPGA